MSLLDEYSIVCKNKECGNYNLSAPYCIDCAIEKLLEAKINRNTIRKVIIILYGEEECKYSMEFKTLTK